MPALFELGQVGQSQAVAETVKGAQLVPLIHRHKNGDWGDLPDDDKERNDTAVKDGSRIFSSYDMPSVPDKKVWIITEADRSRTTALFPSDY